MKTEYFCKTCKAVFSDKKLPNIHRVHFCGTVSRIVRHTAEDEDENAES